MNTDITIRYLLQRTGTWCNCRRPTCWADALLHCLHIHWHWLCDRHDAHIMKRCGA